MKKNFVVSFLTLLLFGLSLVIFDSNVVKASTINQRLSEPEEGWKRYDDTEVAFTLTGSWEQGNSPAPSAFYKGTHTWSEVKGDTIEFEFKGTELRLLTRKGPDRAKNLKVIIDGDEATFSSYNASFTNGFDIVYEKKGLVDKEHNVIIENGDGWFYFDGIDINEGGELLEPKQEPETPVETNAKAKLFVANESIYKLVDGEVYAWGENKYGQLGLGDTKKRSISSKEKVNIPEKIVNLVVGKNFVVALGESGKVYGWGDNTSELFGDNGGLILFPIEFDEDIQSIIKAE